MLPVARQATSERSWTFTCSLTTTIVFASIMSPMPQSALDDVAQPWPDEIVMTEEMRARVTRRWKEYGL